MPTMKLLFTPLVLVSLNILSMNQTPTAPSASSTQSTEKKSVKRAPSNSMLDILYPAYRNDVGLPAAPTQVPQKKRSKTKQ